MTEADVRNAGMSKETEGDFREMTYVQRVFLFVSIARNMYSVWNLEFKTWKQQISCVLESDTLSDHERTDVIRTDYTAECEEENARMTQKLTQFEDEDAKTLTLKSIMLETLFDEADAFEGRSFDTYWNLRVVIIRYLSSKKVGVNDEIRFSEYYDESCTDPGRKRQESAQEQEWRQHRSRFLSCISNSGKAKTRVRVRTKTKEFVGTAKNGPHNIGCFNDKQNTWTEEIWRGQRDSRSDKSADRGWMTSGKSC